MLNELAQTRAQGVLDDYVARGIERGLQVAAYRDGEIVVDAWAGVADPSTGRLVDGDALFTIFSATKAVAATAVHLLAERGKIDYETPVARYWPEFGTHGKEQITVRHLLSHMSGVPQLPDGTTPEDLCDWDGMCRSIADLVPLWETGTKPGYSSFSWGWIVGEVVRRVDGRPVAEFVQEEFCRPLSIDSLFIGIPDSVESRVATLEDGGWVDALNSRPPGPVKSVLPSHLGTPDVFNRADVRRASLPAIGGIANARSLARFYAALTSVGLDGACLVPPERVRTATTMQTDVEDAVLGTPARRALGYALGAPLIPMGERMTAFGHQGIGGAIGFADPEYGFAFALTKNRLTVAPPEETLSLVVAREIRAALGIPES